jgi:hypothetical protein
LEICFFQIEEYKIKFFDDFSLNMQYTFTTTNYTGGYTDARSTYNVTDSILHRWIGWKVVMYNINNNAAVKVESYLDDKNNNNWTKATDVIDNGGWYAIEALIENFIVLVVIDQRITL